MAGAPEENRNAALGDTNMDATINFRVTDQMKAKYQQHARNVHNTELPKLIRKLLDQDIEREGRPKR